MPENMIWIFLGVLYLTNQNETNVVNVLMFAIQ